MFRVDQRGVRERMERLNTNYKAKMREDESAGGITADQIRELDTLICEIIERERIAEEAESNANWKEMMPTRKLQKRCGRLQWKKQGKDN